MQNHTCDGHIVTVKATAVAESRPLIHFLTKYATRPENVYRHRWRVGDVVIWDNRATMHYAVHDYDETMPRLLHRTTAAGP